MSSRYRTYGRRMYSAAKSVGKMAASAAVRQVVSKAFRYKKKKVYKKKNKPGNLQYQAIGNRKVYKKSVRRRKINTRKGLAKQVKSLQKQMNTNSGRFTYRIRSTGNVVASVNECNHTGISGWLPTNLEAAISSLPFFNPATPGTLTTADFTSGTYNKDILFRTLTSKLTLRNNYQIPCNIRVYKCVPKSATSITPTTAFTNGLADQGAPASTSPLVFISDSEQFLDLYKIVRTDKAYLQPGDQYTVSDSDKNVIYDPSFLDSQTATLDNKRYKNFSYVVRVDGCLAHDSSASERGQAQGAVDYQIDRIFHIQYDAGVDLNYISVSDSSNTFTNGAVVSNKPVADNQSYSVN